MNEATATSNKFSDAAALDDLAGEAAALDAGAQDASDLPDAGVAVNDASVYLGEASGLLRMVHAFVAAKAGVTIDKATLDEGAEKLAAVLAKHGGVMPAWLRPYQEEFNFGVWAAGVGFGIWTQVQAKRAAEAKAAKAQEAGAANSAQSPSVHSVA